MTHDSPERLRRVTAAVRAIQSVTHHYAGEIAPGWLWTLSMAVFPALEAEQDRLEKLFGRRPPEEPAVEGEG